MDLMITYGTTDLDNIKIQNRWASAFTGGYINKWKLFNNLVTGVRSFSAIIFDTVCWGEGL